MEKTYKGKSMKLGGGGKFAKMADSLMKQGFSADSAARITAEAGRKKLGKEKFQKLAAKGRRK